MKIDYTVAEKIAMTSLTLQINNLILEKQKVMEEIGNRIRVPKGCVLNRTLVKWLPDHIEVPKEAFNALASGNDNGG